MADTQAPRFAPGETFDPTKDEPTAFNLVNDENGKEVVKAVTQPLPGSAKAAGQQADFPATEHSIALDEKTTERLQDEQEATMAAAIEAKQGNHGIALEAPATLY